MRTTIIAISLLGLLGASGATAKDKFLGKFDDWDASSTGAGKDHLCYVVALPTKAADNEKPRGESSLMVYHAPADKKLNVVQFTAGLALKKDTDAALKIDQKSVPLFVQGNKAWAKDAKTDAEIVAALKAGKTLTIESTSAKGAKLTDAYSLKGFAAAIKAANEACGIK